MVEAHAPFLWAKIILRMVESRFSECGLVTLNEQELQERGGVSWKDIIRFIMYAERLLKYIDEYEDDARKGFKKGWRML